MPWWNIELSLISRKNSVDLLLRVRPQSFILKVLLTQINKGNGGFNQLGEFYKAFEI